MVQAVAGQGPDHTCLPYNGHPKKVSAGRSKASIDVRHCLQPNVLTMVSHLYRFRSTYAALDGRKELEEQHIYFAPSEKLNDPMEGYKDVFWTGDLIVWRNLLRHYLLCLLQCFLLPPMCDNAGLKKLVFSAPENLLSTTEKAIYQKMCEAFRGDANIQQHLEALSTRSAPVRRDELNYYLRSLHAFALRTLMASLEQYGIKGIFRDLDAVRSLATTTKEALARVVALKPAEPEMAEDLFLASELDMAQRELLQTTRMRHHLRLGPSCFWSAISRLAMYGRWMN